MLAIFKKKMLALIENLLYSLSSRNLDSGKKQWRISENCQKSSVIIQHFKPTSEKIIKTEATEEEEIERNLQTLLHCSKSK